MKRKMKTSHLCISLLGIALVTACGEDYHEPVWSHTFESDSGNESCGNDIAFDAEGNVVIVGKYEGRIDLGSGELPFVQNGSAWFVAKYTSDGTNLWSKLLSSDDFVPRLAVDPQGDIVVAGSFLGSVTIGGATLTTVLGGRDVFVVKLDSSGEYLWSKNFGGPGWAHVMGVGTDKKLSIIVTGFFDDEISFGPTSLSAVGDGDGYIAQLEPTGEHRWSNRFGGMGGDHALGLSVASDGMVAISGDSFGSSPSDVVHRYTPSGDLQESWSLPAEALGSVAWAKDGRDLFVHASIEEPQTLGNSETPVSGDFLARVAPGGDPVWISQKSESEREWRDIAVDDQDRVHLVSDSRVGPGDGRVVWVTSYDVNGDKLGRTEVLNSLGGARVTAVAAGPNGQIVLTGCAKDDGFFGGDENLFIVGVRAP